ncbi:hypothetical protein EKN38_12895 [Enterobacter sp. WCHEn045836]|nr:hypothetical protein [Enterobacter sp. WCHEn045836]RTQ01269.1 hypothetical protein EKN38_12895 [Enterobacter sp. WCHEn045836]
MTDKEMVDLFVTRTGETREIAKKYLEDNYWSFSTALTFYRADKNEGKN